MVSERLRNFRSVLLPVVAISIVLVSVIAALVLVGSPAQERRRWADEVRIRDLQTLKQAVDHFYDKQKRLPVSLAELKQQDTTLQTADAQTKSPYTYRSLGQREYEICAVFDTDTDRETAPSAIPSEHSWYADKSLPFWKHRSGAQCFRL